MSEAQDGSPPGNAGPCDANTGLRDISAGPAVSHDEPRGKTLPDDVAGEEGHSMLSRHASPQGRRSLFRS